MADKESTTTTASFTFTLQNSDGEQDTRTISFDTNLEGYTAKENFAAFKANYLANYKYAIQPTGWRDSDDEEEAYECVGIGAKLIEKTETEFDI